MCVPPPYKWKRLCSHTTLESRSRASFKQLLSPKSRHLNCHSPGSYDGHQTPPSPPYPISLHLSSLRLVPQSFLLPSTTNPISSYFFLWKIQGSRNNSAVSGLCAGSTTHWKTSNFSFNFLTCQMKHLARYSQRPFLAPAWDKSLAWGLVYSSQAPWAAREERPH